MTEIEKKRAKIWLLVVFITTMIGFAAYTVLVRVASHAETSEIAVNDKTTTSPGLVGTCARGEKGAKPFGPMWLFWVLAVFFLALFLFASFMSFIAGYPPGLM